MSTEPTKTELHSNVPQQADQASADTQPDLQRWATELEEFVQEVSNELSAISAGIDGDFSANTRNSEAPQMSRPAAPPVATTAPESTARGTSSEQGAAVDSGSSRLQSLRERLSQVGQSDSPSPNGGSKND